jgi:hypothetical protein
MSKIAVSGIYPVPVRRPQGSTVTFANQDPNAACIFYLSVEHGALSPFPPASTAVGGFQIAKGVAFEWQNFPGQCWVRASGGTSLPSGGSDNLEITP